MGQQQLYHISLIAAYVAGIAALFAPCCISYLLPTYFGNIFKEKSRILLMTTIYSLGIFVVLLPVVLGARAVASFFFSFHDQTYIIGSFFLFAIALLTFFNIKIPMLHIKNNRKVTADIPSTFILGIFSGITSACCAPVLAGVITLGSLSPSLVQALGVGIVYVLGMVSPLYITSLFVEKTKITKKPFLKKKAATLYIGNKQIPIFISNIIASFVFSATGIIMLYLALTGRLGMSTQTQETTKSFYSILFKLSAYINAIPFADFIFTSILLLVVIYILIKKFKQNK